MDALRGIAAIAVVLYHFGSRLGAPVTVAHGYLAVDFFFMLSGFVLAHSYAEKFPRLTITRFALIRAIRLLPMSMLGVLLGTAYFLMRLKVQPAASDSLAQILGASVLNLALIPKLWSAGATGGEIFPADGVLWSLSFEFLVNLAWAAALVRLKPRAQLVVAMVGAAVMAYYVTSIGNVNLGWNWGTYAGGVGRTAFGFLMGVMIWRYKPIVQVSLVRPIFAVVLLVLTLGFPFEAPLYDLLIVVLVFPALIYLAASADFGVENGIVKFLADISYPVYAVHLPILMAMSGVLKRFTHYGSHPPAFLYIFAIPIIVIAWCLVHWYELPARRWLGQRLLKKG